MTDIGTDATWPPSEFGGKVQKSGIQPHPHEMTASEKLRQGYLTGQDVDSSIRPDDKERASWNGLIPEAEQRKLYEEAGLFDKGEVWEEMTGG